jgi:hypothetical protein
MISEFTEPLILLRTAIYLSLILTLYKVGALRTVWNSASVKLKLYPSPGKPTYWSTITLSILYNPDWLYVRLECIYWYKLNFHDHINNIFPQCIKYLGVVRSIISNLSSLEWMLRLRITLIRSKLKYASVVWNAITSTSSRSDAIKLKAKWKIRTAAILLFYIEENIF